MTQTATQTAQIETAALTEAQIVYIELERKFAQFTKPFLDMLNDARQAVIDESNIKQTGEPIYFQDSFGVVHAVTVRDYISVKMEPFGIGHTRRPELGETKGSLSEKAAIDAGFTPVINKEPK